MDNLEFTLYALNTVHATRWELFKAKWFGKKRIQRDNNVEITVLQYKDLNYMTEYREINEDNHE